MKNFILDLSSLSVQVKFNKGIEIPEWLNPFLISKPHKVNIKINFFFGKHKAILKEGSVYYCFFEENDELTKIRQTLVLIRSILSNLYNEMNIFMVHASAIIFNNKSFIFIGKSDEGKTTIARTFGSKDKIINDECLIIHKINSEFWVSSFPLNRNKELLNNIFTKIDNVFFIQKSNITIKHEIEEEKAMGLLIHQILPQNMDLDSISELLLEFTQKNNIALLEHYPFNKEAFIREALK